jgi:hypothetical protein
MSKRNTAWLIAILAVGGVVWISAGPLWGLITGFATLIASEVIERSARKRKRAARGETDSPSLKDAVARKRRRR